MTPCLSAAIALIGASEEARAVGAVAAKNMLGGGFAGRVMLVNPHHVEVFGACCYASVASLPERPDLAVIATPAPTVPGLVADLAKAGCRAVIVLTAGLSPELRQQMLDAARPTLMRILGPNCLGLLSPAAGINASFAQAAAHPGGLALLSQSGAVATVMLDWLCGGVGFSHISLGDISTWFGDFSTIAFDQRRTPSDLRRKRLERAKFISPHGGRAPNRSSSSERPGSSGAKCRDIYRHRARTLFMTRPSARQRPARRYARRLRRRRRIDRSSRFPGRPPDDHHQWRQARVLAPDE
jgi:acetyltransferase